MELLSCFFWIVVIQLVFKCFQLHFLVIFWILA